MNRAPIDLYEAHRNQFDRYQELLLKWNDKFNLTAITAPKEIVEKHFVDSLFVLQVIEKTNDIRNVPRGTLGHVTAIPLLDLGAGAGFPGLPLKIVCPNLRVTLVDSIKKKCDFMKEIIRDLRLSDVKVLHQRVDENTKIGKFDFVVSRAAWKMETLLPYSYPNLKSGGRVIAMKSKEVAKELMECEGVIRQYRFQPIEEIAYQLPFSKQHRKLLVTSL